jgi:hypothetical protein
MLSRWSGIPAEDLPPVGEMVTDTLTLPVFTFGLIVSRFDVRRGQLIEAANTIGTTFSLGGCFPSPIGRRFEP